jgi:hypothetical protein
MPVKAIVTNRQRIRSIGCLHGENGLAQPGACAKMASCGENRAGKMNKSLTRWRAAKGR